MKRTRGLPVALALSVAAAVLGVAVAPQATALTPPVGFTADDLPTWQTNGIVWAMAEADGVVFAGGTFSAVRPPEGASGTAQEALSFVALDAATGAPTDCSLSFTVSQGTATVRALAVSPDKSTLYVGGYFGAVNGKSVSSAAAIDIATCTSDGFHAVFPRPCGRSPSAATPCIAGGDFGRSTARPGSGSPPSTPPPAPCAPSRRTPTSRAAPSSSRPTGSTSCSAATSSTSTAPPRTPSPWWTPPPARTSRRTPTASSRTSRSSRTSTSTRPASTPPTRAPAASTAE